MRVETDGFSFDFTDALEAFVFDEQDKAKSTYHGQPMKAVDILAEFEEASVYVEIKDFHAPERYDPVLGKEGGFNCLKTRLKYKYRDSYLYRYAEDRVEKPIHYICLLNFDNALNTRMQKALRRELPLGKASLRWKREIVRSCQVVNLERWNRNFPKWPASRIPAGVA